jgi:nucleoside-diphosphate-sugar epimerase
VQILVTGANGFLGRNLVEKLLAADHQVTCLVRRPPSPPLGANAPIKNLRYLEGDLQNISVLREAVSNQEVIYHLAGAVAAPSQEAFNQTNVLGTENLLNTIQIHNRDCQKIVVVSSLAAAGHSEQHLGRVLPKKEEDPRLPISQYGISKKLAEETVLKFSDQLKTIVIRPPIVYGPWDKQLFPFFKMARYGISTPFYGLPKYYSVIFVDDLVCGLIQAASSKVPSGSIYYMSDPAVYSWNDLVQAIVNGMDAITLPIPISQTILKFTSIIYDAAAKWLKRPLAYGSDKYQEFAAPGWVCTPAKAQTELGFQTTFNLWRGMEATAAWYRDMRWL